MIFFSDEEVRQGLKTFSNWPTYPQLYKNGTLIGGLDVMKEMAENDELADLMKDDWFAAFLHVTFLVLSQIFRKSCIVSFSCQIFIDFQLLKQLYIRNDSYPKLFFEISDNKYRNIFDLIFSCRDKKAKFTVLQLTW